jgi:GT2 family glycosyltransferase
LSNSTQDTPADTAGTTPSVTTIVLNYNAPLETMLKCLDSLARQTWENHRVLLVDNASTIDIFSEVEKKHPQVEIMRLEANLGFSGGINRGVEHASTDYVCLLNFDTMVDPAFVAEMVAVAETDPEIAAVAPKMLFADDPHIFDSMGTAMAENAGAFNQAIGQPDIGQYDMSERVFGACFGAALVRKEEFAPDRVGALDESYFMYFEDVDWCMRANLLGRKFCTAPAAVVFHEHSASVKDRGYDYKYKLIELNLLRTVVKNYQRRQAVKIPLRRLKNHLRNATSRRSGRAAVSWAIILAFLADLPRLLPKRWEIQRRRRVSDYDVLKSSFNELPFYDPTTYHPLYSLETLQAAYRRLFVVAGDRTALQICQGLDVLNTSKLRTDDRLLSERLQQLLAGQPDHVLEFASKVTAGR